MSVIVLLDADDAEFVNILMDGESFENMIFPSVELADLWLQENARVGWCTRIVDLDD